MLYFTTSDSYRFNHSLQLHVSMSGAFPVLSLMIGSVVTRLVPDDGPPANITGFDGLTMDQQRAIVSASLTFLIGIFQVFLIMAYSLAISALCYLLIEEISAEL